MFDVDLWTSSSETFFIKYIYAYKTSVSYSL